MAWASCRSITLKKFLKEFCIPSLACPFILWRENSIQKFRQMCITAAKYKNNAATQVVQKSILRPTMRSSAGRHKNQ